MVKDIARLFGADIGNIVNEFRNRPIRRVRLADANSSHEPVGQRRKRCVEDGADFCRVMPC
jgi:hypothetical protein